MALTITDEQRAITADAVAAANQGKTIPNSTGISGDFTFFLKMLTTQLKNQDPTEPMDVSQMTQQIATYSGVEQQTKTNTLLSQMIDGNKQSQLSTAVSYIGKEVETEGNTGNLVSGQAAFSYILPKTASSVTITILNSANQAVFQGQGTTKAGRNLVVWDGMNSFNSQAMPEGTYTIRVAAKDEAGKDMTADARAVGVVNTVETDEDGNIVLNVGDVRVKYSDILAVRQPTIAYLPDTGGEDTTAGGEDTTGGGDDTVAGGEDTTSGGA